MQKMISSKKRTLGVLGSTQSWDCLLKTACLAAGIPVCSWILLGYATLEGVNSLHWTLDDFFALKGESSPQEALFQLFDFTIQPDKLAFSQLYPLCNWWNRCFSTTQQGGAHQREKKTAPLCRPRNAKETFKERLQILSSSWAIANSDAWKMRLVLSLSYLSWWWPVGWGFKSCTCGWSLKLDMWNETRWNSNDYYVRFSCSQLGLLCSRLECPFSPAEYWPSHLLSGNRT